MVRIQIRKPVFVGVLEYTVVVGAPYVISLRKVFVPHHFIECYNFTEFAHDFMFVRLPVEFDALWICHDMKVEQESVF